MTNRFLKQIRLSRIGFRTEQKGIIQRYINEQESWGKHLNHCKRVIIDRFKGMQPDKIRILGSGWLLDVPMDELLNSKATIILTDILHPSQIIHRYRNNPRVIFEQFDLNAGLTKLLISKKPSALSYFEIRSAIEGTQLPTYAEPMVVSLNLLSQLSVIPLRYIKSYGKLSGAQTDKLAALIQQKHLLSLPPESSIVISDYSEEYYSNGKFWGAKPTLHTPIEHFHKIDEWDWQFDTRQTYRADCTTLLKVRAFELK